MIYVYVYSLSSLDLPLQHGYSPEKTTRGNHTTTWVVPSQLSRFISELQESRLRVDRSCFFRLIPPALLFLSSSIQHLSLHLFSTHIRLKFKMTPHERLKMLLEGDMNLMDLDTLLNKANTAKPAQAEDGAVPGSKPHEAKQGVSGNVSSVYYDPRNPMGISKHQYLPVSYIRSYVIGEHAEPENNHLTPVDQDDGNSSDFPNPHPEGPGLPQDEHPVDGIIPGTRITTISTPSFFTPAVTMARYPLQYIYGENAKRVNARFYAGDKFWNRTWDLFVEYSE